MILLSHRKPNSRISAAAWGKAADMTSGRWASEPSVSTSPPRSRYSSSTSRHCSTVVPALVFISMPFPWEITVRNSSARRSHQGCRSSSYSGGI